MRKYLNELRERGAQLTLDRSWLRAPGHSAQVAAPLGAPGCKGQLKNRQPRVEEQPSNTGVLRCGVARIP